MRRIKKLLVVGSIGLVVAAGGETLPQVPEEWKLIPVNGKYMYNADLGRKDHFWKLWDNYADEPMFENMWLEIPGPYFVLEDKFTCDWKTAEFVPETRFDRSYSTPHRITEMLAHWKANEILEKFKARRPTGPITFAIWNTRPIWALPDYSVSDTVDFLNWKKNFPGFVGMHAYDEYDSDAGGIHNKCPLLTNHVDRARMAAYAGMPFNEGARQWIDIDHPKIRSFLFGSEDLCGLVANVPTTCFLIARKGLKFMWYEAEMGSTSAPHRWGGLYARGAARQFHTPLGWYTAPFTFNTLCRDGSEPPGLQNYVTYTQWPSVEDRKAPKYTGAARSLINRNNVYGYLIGAVAQMHEGSSKYLTAFTDKEPDKVILSPYGEDQRRLFAWDKANDRGVPYTPVAFLVSLDEQFDRQSYGVQRNHDRFAQTAFLTTLCCPKMKSPAMCCDPKKGLQGCMFNSEFGEFVDALCPDAGQRTEDFYRVLRNYRAAILMGWYNPKYFDKEAIVRYVKEGGCVFAERAQVAAGLVPESVPDAKGHIKIVENFVCDYIRTGKTDWWQDKMPKLYSGEVENPEIRDLLRKLQERLLPVTVEGDIHWGVNRTKEGWLVWLINNNGVTKFFGEPEEFDPKATSVVRITCKATGRTYTARVKPGDWTAVRIVDGDFRETVQVK